ncbi:hypothetical protein FNO01nite_26130 [Flavobacterium noncentrifugens]|uniref:Uncharacterized protein n=2 Tax=Flavobacterium noncentrifugens TaxID=1128970 RepID=A0A1G8ZJD7_9FLAO|nr:hypothetical protein FNO01nite_26130 [Flavobacterium noncentrifugens]SDK14240.1 hypothetical protein SAMN04487935_2586 [Flavobacterium noncentrifugens]
MFQVMLLFHFTQSIHTWHDHIPELESELSLYIRKHIEHAELIDVSLIGSASNKSRPKYSKNRHANVFIGFIALSSHTLFDSYLEDKDAVKDFVMDGFCRESIYFQRYWNDSDNRYYIVNLIKFDGKIPSR